MRHRFIPAIVAIAIGVATATLAFRSAAQSSTPWPEVPEPLKSRVEWIAKDVRINGLASRIEHFDSTVGVEEMLAHYRAHWSRSPAGRPMENEARGWRSISTRHGPFQMVVQIKPQGERGSEGLISVTNVLEARADYIPRDLPRVADSKVLQVTESVDGPLRGFLVTLASTQGVDMTARRYRDEWKGRGWAVADEISSHAGGPQAYVASFRRADESVDMTIVESSVRGSRQSRVTVNLMSPASKDKR